MTLPGRRLIAFGAFLACGGMMGFALYAQHVLLLEPCPLCILQRVVVIALGAVFLVSALHSPAGWARRVYAAALAIVALSGIGVAGWHVRLQSMPDDEVPSCGPGLEYLMANFPLTDALRMIFRGSGECAEVAWRLLGLSMPAWVLVCLVVLGVVGVWNSLRQ